MVFPLGAAALGLIVLALAGVLADRLPVPRVETIAWVGIALLGALALWSAVSIDWSLSPERSWAYANRLIVYLLFLLVGLFAGATTRRAPTFAATGMTILVAATAGWALASKIAPALADDGSPVARLRAPVGYWNGLAFVLAVGVPLALWVASNQSLRRPLRAAGVALAASLLVALFLTYSRSGVLGAVVTAGVWLALVPRKRASVGALLVAFAVAAAVCAVALTLPGVSEDAQSYAARREDGRIFGAVLGGALVCAFGIAWLGLRLGDRLPERLTPRGPQRPPPSHPGGGLPGRARCRGICVRVGRPRAARVRQSAHEPSLAGSGSVHESQLEQPVDLVERGLDRLSRRAVDRNRGVELPGRPPARAGGCAYRHDAPQHAAPVPRGARVDRRPRRGRCDRAPPRGAHTTRAPPDGLATRGRGRPSGRDRGIRALCVARLPARLRRRKHSGLPVRRDAARRALRSPRELRTGALARTRCCDCRRRSGSGLARRALARGAPSRTHVRAARGTDAPSDALAVAESAADLNPLALESTFAEARANIALGRIDRARDVLVEGVRTHPSDSTAWAELARLELAVPGREGIGADYLDRSRQLDPVGRSPATP